MSGLAGFDFMNADQLSSFEGCFIGIVPKGISSTDELLQCISTALSFPAYFGKNWNALYDCLRDFHWSEIHQIVLIHYGLPQIPESDLKTYLEVLRDAVADWKPGEPHQLKVVFDGAVEARVAEVLRS